MSDKSMIISIPVDSSGFLRRSCSYCKKEFKILLTEDDNLKITKTLFDTFLLSNLDSDKNDSENFDDEDDKSNYFCPYCGQVAKNTEWWTEEQANFVSIYAENMANQIINEHLRKQLHLNNSGFIKITINELPYKEPWISPEENDLDIFALPCCNDRIKIDLTKVHSNVICFKCGFPHKIA